MKKTQPIEPAAAVQTDYILPIPHQHAGIDYPAGAVLALYPDQIALIEAVAAQIAATNQQPAQ